MDWVISTSLPNVNIIWLANSYYCDNKHIEVAAAGLYLNAANNVRKKSGSSFLYNFLRTINILFSVIIKRFRYWTMSKIKFLSSSKVWITWEAKVLQNLSG